MGGAAPLANQKKRDQRNGRDGVKEGRASTVATF